MIKEKSTSFHAHIFAIVGDIQITVHLRATTFGRLNTLSTLLYCLCLDIGHRAPKNWVEQLFYPLKTGYPTCLDNQCFFHTCQVRVVRFYVSCFLLVLLVLVLLLLLPLLVLLLLLLSSLLLSSPRLLSSSPLLLLPAGLQPRPSTPSVPCRTSTTTITAQCSLPDLNREYPRPVFPAGPQPRPSPPSVPCRTSTTTIHAQCSLPDLNREYPRQVFPAGPHVGR